MPYADTEWAVIISGELPAGEVWANRWTIAETDVGADLLAAAGAFHAVYASWAGVCDSDWKANNISFRNLVNGGVVQPAWVQIVGEEGDSSPLPTECALRVSLSAMPNRKGGPYFCGVSTDHVDNSGQMAAVSLVGFVSALEALFDDLVAADFALRLDSPSDTETKEISACRVGRTFDVIRRRRNQIPESYINVPVTP